LEQHVYSHTRGNNVLDVVFTSELKLKRDVFVMAPTDNSDHNVLVCISGPKVLFQDLRRDEIRVWW